MAKDTGFRNQEYKNKRVLQWISVKDRLPTHNQIVLICADGDYYYQSKFYNTKILNDELKEHNKDHIIDDVTSWPNVFCSLEGYYCYKFVTHWADISRLKPDDN